jgi:ribonuclease J
MKPGNVFIPEIGVPIELSAKQGAAVAEQVPSGSILIDGLGIGDVGNVVLRDRKILSQDGLFIVVATISREDAALVSGPEIISRGFIYMRESEQLLIDAKKLVCKVIEDCLTSNVKEWVVIKGKIKKSLSGMLYQKTKRSPMILPIIIEV